jgi:hypothetical protein
MAAALITAASSAIDDTPLAIQNVLNPTTRPPLLSPLTQLSDDTRFYTEAHNKQPIPI